MVYILHPMMIGHDDRAIKIVRVQYFLCHCGKEEFVHLLLTKSYFSQNMGYLNANTCPQLDTKHKTSESTYAPERCINDPITFITS